jgi:hypothetical protein
MNANDASLTDWLTAIGTVAAVVVALGAYFSVWVRRRIRRPLLSLAHDADHSEIEHNPLLEVSVPYIRLRIANGPKKEPANDVQILVEEIVRLLDGEPAYPIYLANPALGWTNAVDDSIRMSIPPGTQRYVDLGYILFDGDAMRFALAVVPQPAQGRHVPEPGDYLISLAVAGRNADARFWEVSFSLDSEWPGDDLWEHIRISTRDPLGR